jgi:integrase
LVRPGYKSKIRLTDAEYFNLSDKDVRVATARRERPSPTLDQIKTAIALMPLGSEVERRDRAVVAFVLLTGVRDSALISMKLKHVDLAGSSIYQDARDVKTKFSKTFLTVFFPVGDEVRQIVEEWTSLLSEKGWGPEDPLFPATEVTPGAGHAFEPTGLKRVHWHTTTPVRKIFREAFTRAGLPYFNPHSVRNTLVRLAESMCQTPEELKAWSQNLGHESVLLTLSAYGNVKPSRQTEIILGLGKEKAAPSPDVKEIFEELGRKLGCRPPQDANGQSSVDINKQPSAS